VREVGRLEDGGWEVDGIPARAGVLATGGLSVLAGGADGAGLGWAAGLGHTVRPTYPALAPLTASGTPHAALTGVSLEARVEASAGGERAVSSGGFLFTHRGYSGPAALDVSHVVERHRGAARVRVRFASGLEEALRGGAGTVRGTLRRLLPDRLAELLLSEAGVEDVPLARLTREARRALAQAVEGWTLPADGTEGYRTAEVTGGGVALEEVDAGSGASRLHSGLFLAGEMLDAFGPIGGFNFQWAWASGRSAGLGAAKYLVS
jgi:predicted Rossmann fold flavoprotein